MKKVLSVLAIGLLSVGLVAYIVVDESEKEVDKTVEKEVKESKEPSKPTVKPVDEPIEKIEKPKPVVEKPVVESKPIEKPKPVEPKPKPVEKPKPVAEPKPNPIEKPKPVEEPAKEVVVEESNKEFINVVSQQNRDEVLAIITSHAETYWADDYGMKEYVIREQMDYYDTLSSLKIDTQEEQDMLKRVFHDHAYNFIAMEFAYTEELEKLEKLD